MNQRTLFVIALIGCLAIILLWQPWQRSTPAPDVQVTEHTLPDFTAENLVTRIFAPNGRLLHRIHASYMAHFSQQNLTELQEPVYITQLENQPESAGETWQVKANQGRFYNEEKLELLTQVEVTNLSNIGYIQQIETDYLAIDLQTQQMYTDAAVIIRGSQFLVRGIGLVADLETHQLELKQHVETIYYPQQPIRP